MREVGDLPEELRAVHALNRLAFGPRPGDLAQVRALGVEEYIRRQLHPESVPIPDDLISRVAAYRTLHMTPAALFREFQLPVMEARRENKDASPEALKS